MPIKRRFSHNLYNSFITIKLFCSYHFIQDRSNRPQICLCIILLKFQYLRCLISIILHNFKNHLPYTTANHTTFRPYSHSPNVSQTQNPLQFHSAITANIKPNVPIFNTAVFGSFEDNSKFCGFKSRCIILF